MIKGIWWSSSTDGVHWSAPAAITTTAALSPSLAMNPDGVAVVAWSESTPNNEQLATSFRSAPGAAWSTPVTVAANDSEYEDHTPAVAVSGKGEAFVVWVQADMGAADEDSIWEMHHTAAGWSKARLFETYNEGACWVPSVAANAAGNVIAAWIQVGSLETIRARRYTFGAADFDAAVDVTQGEYIDNFQGPGLVLDEAGTATVAWSFAVQQKWQTFATRAGATETWPVDAMAMETDNAAAYDDPNDATARATLPTLGIDPTGNVTLVWRKRVGKRFDVWARRLPKATGVWGTATLLETHDTDSAEWPTLGVGSDGTAVATWGYGTEADIWAAVFR